MPLLRAAPQGTAKPYKPRKQRVSKLTASVKAARKAIVGDPQTGGTPAPLARPQRKMPMKQNLPVKPLPGQKTAADKLKLTPAPRREKKAGANPYRRKRNTATY